MPHCYHQHCWRLHSPNLQPQRRTKIWARKKRPSGRTPRPECLAAQINTWYEYIWWLVILGMILLFSHWISASWNHDCIIGLIYVQQPYWCPYTDVGCISACYCSFSNMGPKLPWGIGWFWLILCGWVNHVIPRISASKFTRPKIKTCFKLQSKIIYKIYKSLSSWLVKQRCKQQRPTNLQKWLRHESVKPSEVESPLVPLALVQPSSSHSKLIASLSRHENVQPSSLWGKSAAL